MAVSVSHTGNVLYIQYYVIKNYLVPYTASLVAQNCIARRMPESREPGLESHVLPFRKLVKRF